MLARNSLISRHVAVVIPGNPGHFFGVLAAVPVWSRVFEAGSSEYNFACSMVELHMPDWDVGHRAALLGECGQSEVRLPGHVVNDEVRMIRESKERDEGRSSRPERGPSSRLVQAAMQVVVVRFGQIHVKCADPKL